MPALSPASRQRGVLSPRPAPRQEDAVVVVAQEALAAAALNWQERAERLQQANVRLKERVNEAENARRRSLTVVKNVPALPNNHVFTKQLVDENHALRRETRELQRRLMQFEGPGARYRSASKSKTTRRRAAKITNSTPARVEAGTEKSRALEKVAEVQQKEEALAEQNQAETSPARETVDGLARHPLVQELKQHLLNLEVDLERVRQENTLLRGELEQYQTAGEKTRLQDHGKRLAGHLDTDDQVELQSSVASLLQQIKLLEARYQHLEEKARAKAALYQETTTRLEEMSVQLFEAQQQISAQAEQIQLNSDRAALEDDLLQEFHLLRSENMKLNETVATLSSRPFDALSNDLAKKNIWIAQLEDEVRELETDRANLQNECATTRRTSEHLRYRIETLTTETKDLANELCQVKAECEQQTMQMEVAQLQLRFYTSPDDYVLMSAVGKALKEMKKKELKDNHSEDAGRSRKNEASEDKMIFRSRHPTLAIPADASLWNVVEQHAREIGEKPAFICGLTERTLTYEDLHRQAKQVCAGLAANGISKGDVVLLHSINCIEYPMVFLALNRLGAICSPSSPQFTAEELADQIEAAQAVAVISHEKFTKVATQAAAMRGMPKQQVYALKQIEGSSDLQTIENLVVMDLPFPNLPPIDTNQVVALPFSSGTTGRPKGVELTARAMFSSGMIPGYTVEKVKYLLGMLPFFHIMATMIFHISLYMGMAMVVLPGFDPNTFLRTAEKYKIKRLHLAPPLVKFLAKHPLVDRYNLSATTQASSGGSPLGKKVEQAVLKRLGIQVLQSYGMTEFAGVGTHSSITSHREGSSGTLYPNVELKVKCLETDADLATNKRGELLFRSPALMKGYFNNPEATRNAFTSDGFVRTGDIGYIDDDGFVFIVDRLKELIKYKGHQVAPAEIEDVLNSHPRVVDSACVRGHDQLTGEEIPKAFVVVEAGANPLSEEELMAFVAAKVTGYKRVRAVEFVDSIPKSSSGKILRRVLQARENAMMKKARSRL